MTDKPQTKRHPAPHVSFKTGKRRCKSANTIIKAKVYGVVGSTIHALKEPDVFKNVLKIFNN